MSCPKVSSLCSYDFKDFTYPLNITESGIEAPKHIIEIKIDTPERLLAHDRIIAATNTTDLHISLPRNWSVINFFNSTLDFIIMDNKQIPIIYIHLFQKEKPYIEFLSTKAACKLKRKILENNHS